ncbi:MULTISPECIES: AAA family ATPase [Streptomyces]|uniref:Cell division protein ZipA n=1 Tax=Streptomyces cacaoi TaxID=1898 RepID=A0A4Y3R3V0_STRCI|nr:MULTISPECIES: ATP-binding protein [Streptomyces]NNG89684.1 ATP-binding protein [Streptomyces cacaoi]QHF93388.1 ATP-binding protein [Streptomyces sp. NHF165]GEB51443.1 cell division protein ZipA [Streptomyces cacaoi]
MSARGGRPVVHLLCGLNGAGKTTYARQLAERLPAVRFGLDAWMLRLYPDVRYDDAAYPGLAAACQEVIRETALQVLRAGTDVVFDWNQWSRDRRAYWREWAVSAGYAARLHHVRVPLETAVARAEARTAARRPGAHPLDAAGVRHLARLFEPPGPDEGLPVTLVEG